MFKYALAGLVIAGLLTFFLAGPVLAWVGHFGSYAVVVTAIVFRLIVLMLAVWLGFSLVHRRPGSMPNL